MENTKSLWKDILRWILFIPGAFAGMFLGNLIALYMNKMTNSFIGKGLTSFKDEWSIINIIGFVGAAFFSAYCFITIGIMIAPKYKNTVAIILCVIYALMVGASIIASIMLQNNIIEVVVAGVISIITIIVIYIKQVNGELDGEYQ